jgi:hypothetical protein
VVVNNSPWSPAVKGVTETRLGDGVTVYENPKPNKYHASALDAVVETFDFDYLMTLETDVCVLRPDWLQWFIDQLERDPHWYAVGHWHHEQFINPSCTLYRAGPLREMLAWCKANESDVMRWGPRFEKEQVLLPQSAAASIRGPFAERRGWPEGTALREKPTGQEKGPGHYEPGQALYHWARNDGDRGYLACPTQTAWRKLHWPYQTLYGDHHELPDRELELSELFGSNFYACHFWLGTGSLNIIKHPDLGVQCAESREYGLPRESRFWKQAVDQDVQDATLALIRKHGWHTESCFGGPVNDRDREAARLVEEMYARGGVRI